MRILIIAFCVFISLPIFMRMGNLRAVDRMPNAELRAKARFPKLRFRHGPKASVNSYKEGYQKLSKDFDHYLNDHLPTKPAFLDIQKKIKVDLLNVSPIPNRVVIGEDGYLFLGDFFNDVVKESTGLKTCTDEQMNTMIRNAISTRNKLKELGIEYYLCIAPNKHTVMSDKLPIRKHGPTDLDVFKEKIGDRINFVDMKQDYHKGEGKMLFNKTNTHFTDIGALYSVQSILNRIKQRHPDVYVPQFSEYNEKLFQPNADEQTRMLRITDQVDKYLLARKNITKAIRQPRRFTVPSTYMGAREFYEVRYKTEGPPLKALVCGDSFLALMIPFMSESFGEVTFVGDPTLNMENIMLDRPDIVIQEMAERSLDDWLPFQN